MSQTVSSDYGDVTVSPYGATIQAAEHQLYAWANRTGAHWPCSRLAGCEYVRAHFDEHGLVDLSIEPEVDIPADELTAWSSDVLGAVLPESHPAHYVNVGQFR